MRRSFRYFNILAVTAIFCFALVRSTFAPPAGAASGTTEALMQRNILLSSQASLRDAARAATSEATAPFAVLPELSASPVDSGGLFDMPALPALEEARREASPAHVGRYSEVWATVTAYCPCARCCGRGSPGITSTGRSAWRPGIAADPQAISYGTRIDVPGYGLHVVDDTGGAMRRSWRVGGRLHLDIRMNYHWQARNWGKRLLKVRVYE